MEGAIGCAAVYIRRAIAPGAALCPAQGMCRHALHEIMVQMPSHLAQEGEDVRNSYKTCAYDSPQLYLAKYESNHIRF